MAVIIVTLILACFATIIIELVPVMLITRDAQWIKASFLCNVITNPIANTFLLMLIVFTGANNDVGMYACMFIIEIAVVFVEAKIYSVMLGKHYLKCLFVSFAANLLSFIVGMVIVSWLSTPPERSPALDDIPVWMYLTK